jgi:hypothetical protein
MPANLMSMTSEQASERMRDILDAIKPPDFEWESVTELVAGAGAPLRQIRVSFTRGNEYLPISQLMTEFAALGRVFVEFRGVGRQEESKIVFEVTTDTNEVVQMIYFIAEPE